MRTPRQSEQHGAETGLVSDEARSPRGDARRRPPYRRRATPSKLPQSSAELSPLAPRRTARSVRTGNRQTDDWKEAFNVYFKTSAVRRRQPSEPSNQGDLLEEH